jgi:hypothetical protein|uniref:Uncharacterized protein n=1 Tax=Myoviridae sp. ctshb19 TaxID=2825194 RepID=A0A8S5UGC5_9CAUD|nr:MAG TPA: hypothetical protein [Myoviridae sp. ctshb19]
MKDLMVVLWVFFPTICVFMVLVGLHDPTVKRDWMRVGVMTFVLSCMLIPYGPLYQETRTLIERNFTND